MDFMSGRFLGSWFQHSRQTFHRSSDDSSARKVQYTDRSRRDSSSCLVISIITCESESSVYGRCLVSNSLKDIRQISLCFTIISISYECSHTKRPYVWLLCVSSRLFWWRKELKCQISQHALYLGTDIYETSCRARHTSTSKVTNECVSGVWDQNVVFVCVSDSGGLLRLRLPIWCPNERLLRHVDTQVLERYQWPAYGKTDSSMKDGAHQMQYITLQMCFNIGPCWSSVHPLWNEQWIPVFVRESVAQQRKNVFVLELWPDVDFFLK